MNRGNADGANGTAAVRRRLWTIAAALAVVLATGAAAAVCDLRAEPDSGPAGTTVRVAGTCDGILYHRYVYIYFDVAEVASFDGVSQDYAVSFKVPARARPGAHEITLRAPFGTATTSFEVSGSPPPCRGDCNLDGRVSIGDLVTGVKIALGGAALDRCDALDADDSGDISIGELITATNAATLGCAMVERCHDARDCDAPTSCRSPDELLGCVGACASGACLQDEDCAAWQECSDAGICVGAECDLVEYCPSNYRCRPVGSTLGIWRCERDTCAWDTCAGFCVNGACWDALGTCR